MRSIFASMIFGVLISASFAACTTGTTTRTSSSTEPLKFTVPPGTYMSVELQDAISTEKSSPGDSFSASLTKDVIVDGLTAFQKGSVVHGRIVDVQEPSHEKGLAQLKLELTSVEHNGKDVPIQTQMYVGIARTPKKNDTENDTALATKGEQLNYPPETRLLFTLSSSVDI